MVVVGGPRRRLDRAAVVAAAEALVDRDGATRLTMTALAKELGVRVPSLYSHVASLETLLGMVQNQAMAELGGDLQRAAMGKSGPAGVRALAAALRAFAQRSPGRYALALSRPIDRPAMQAASDAAAGAFGAVVASMGVPMTNVVASLCLAPLHGALTLDHAALYPRSEIDFDAVYSSAIDLVIVALEQAARSELSVH
jgi:AcrR family transcriptional regulator